MKISNVDWNVIRSYWFATICFSVLGLILTISFYCPTPIYTIKDVIDLYRFIVFFGISLGLCLSPAIISLSRFRHLASKMVGRLIFTLCGVGSVITMVVAFIWLQKLPTIFTVITGLIWLIIFIATSLIAIYLYFKLSTPVEKVK